MNWFGAFGPKHTHLIAGQVFKLQVSNTQPRTNPIFINIIRNKPPAHLNSIHSRHQGFEAPFLYLSAAQAHQDVELHKVTNLNIRLRTLC